MIEINLIPDVKQELLKAQRVRATVISIAILVGIAAAAVVVLLALWVFAVQAARNVFVDNTIKEESQKLSNVEDINNTLTIQNQLSLITPLHDEKNIDSRIFDILNTINPPAPNSVAITSLSLDASENLIEIEAQAQNGYPALEVFKKTIAATKFQFTSDSETNTVDLASNMSDSDRSYGEDASGVKVLRFKLSFEYPDELFARTSKNAKVIAPTKANATDSFRGVPNSLFTQKAGDVQEDN
jgi:Tfp pilus assembly protein PilN